MTIYEMFVQMWQLDYQMKLVGFDKVYFQNLVKSGQLKAEDYQKIVGEAYERTDNQVSGAPQA
ncbi:hypothetical protein LATKL145_01690 [Lactobacillus amylovorus subsp. animalium]|uniref:XkdX family protein n=1 Tax=Lactobacillus amylovorus subsp. animalium TaxID=3378536 RepID=A0ABC9VK00_LACAM